MPQSTKLVFDPAPGNRSRKVPQIPREKILDAAHGRDRNVQGVIRNGYRDETPGEQEGGEHLNVVRDLKEVAIRDEGETLGGHLGIARAGFAHHDRGRHHAAPAAIAS